MRFLPCFSLAAPALVVLATACRSEHAAVGLVPGNLLLGPNVLRDLTCGGSTCYGR